MPRRPTPAHKALQNNDNLIASRALGMQRQAAIAVARDAIASQFNLNQANIPQFAPLAKLAEHMFANLDLLRLDIIKQSYAANTDRMESNKTAAIASRSKLAFIPAIQAITYNIVSYAGKSSLDTIKKQYAIALTACARIYAKAPAISTQIHFDSLPMPTNREDAVTGLCSLNNLLIQASMHKGQAQFTTADLPLFYFSALDMETSPNTADCQDNQTPVIPICQAESSTNQTTLSPAELDALIDGKYQYGEAHIHALPTPPTSPSDSHSEDSIESPATYAGAEPFDEFALHAMTLEEDNKQLLIELSALPEAQLIQAAEPSEQPKSTNYHHACKEFVYPDLG